MLVAITHNKAGRIRIASEQHTLSWRDAFSRSEDLLTAVFFGRFRYLSGSALVFVMARLIGDQEAETLGELKHVEFWPHLTEVNERAWVEPDVLMHFELATVMIEVKPPFGGQQSLDQWRAEITALLAEAKAQSRDVKEKVYFVALGQISSTADAGTALAIDAKAYFDLEICQVEWQRLMTSLRTVDADISATDKAVFDDWQCAFELFGLEPVTLSWDALYAFAAKQRKGSLRWN